MAVLPPDPVFSFRGPDMGAVNSICFHQDERLLAGSLKGSVYLWDLQTNRCSHNFEVGSEPIMSIHHTDETLVTQEKGGIIKLWTVANSRYVLRRKIEANHIGFCRAVVMQSEDESCTDPLLLFPRDEGIISMLNLRTGLTTTADDLSSLTPASHQKLPKLGNVQCMKVFTCTGKTLVLAGYEAGHFVTWDLQTGEPLHVIQLDESPMAVDYDSVTNRGVVGGPAETIATISYDRNVMELRRGADITIKNAGINCLHIRPDLKVFAAGGWDGRIRVFSWKSLRPLAVLMEHRSGGIMDIAYSKGKISMWKAPIMAAAGLDGQITLWNLYN